MQKARLFSNAGVIWQFAGSRGVKKPRGNLIRSVHPTGGRGYPFDRDGEPTQAYVTWACRCQVLHRGNGEVVLSHICKDCRSFFPKTPKRPIPATRELGTNLGALLRSANCARR